VTGLDADRAAIGGLLDRSRLGELSLEAGVRTVDAGLASAGLLPEQREPSHRASVRRVLFEELARRRLTSIGTGLFVNGVVRALLGATVNGPLRAWKARFDAGEATGAFALTEEGCGGELSQMVTRAELGDGRYTLRGEKYCVANAAYADLSIVVARNASVANPFAFELFAVPADATGLSRGELPSHGHRGALGWMRLDSVCLSADMRLTGPGGGLGLLYANLFHERINIAIRAIAMGRVVLDETVEHCRARLSLGAPLVDRQAVQFRLAELHAELVATSAFVMAIATGPAEARFGAESAMAKYEACRLLERISDEAVQLFGGLGYVEGSVAATAFLDAIGLSLSGGSEEAMLATIASSEPPPLRGGASALHSAVDFDGAST
jgi:alkylation response protein AidB-like acyl-CoA dehydrogenase